MPADPRFSAGARLERKAILAHVRRVLKRIPPGVTCDLSDFAQLESWLLKRQVRYSKRKGGL